MVTPSLTNPRHWRRAGRDLRRCKQSKTKQNKKHQSQFIGYTRENTRSRSVSQTKTRPTPLGQRIRRSDLNNRRSDTFGEKRRQASPPLPALTSCSYLDLHQALHRLDLRLAEGPPVLGADIRPHRQVGRLVRCLKHTGTWLNPGTPEREERGGRGLVSASGISAFSGGLSLFLPDSDHAVSRTPALVTSQPPTGTGYDTVERKDFWRSSKQQEQIQIRRRNGMNVPAGGSEVETTSCIRGSEQSYVGAVVSVFLLTFTLEGLDI